MDDNVSGERVFELLTEDMNIDDTVVNSNVYSRTTANIFLNTWETVLRNDFLTGLADDFTLVASSISTDEAEANTYTCSPTVYQIVNNLSHCQLIQRNKLENVVKELV